MRAVDVAITGFGSIGRMIARMLLERRGTYRKDHGIDVAITGVCGSAAGVVDASGLELECLNRSDSFAVGLSGNAFLATVRADILIEAGPSDYRNGGPGLHYLRSALGRGMHAIAVSKGALALDVRGLLRLAAEHGGSLRFSGAAAAALPALDLLQYSLAGSRVLGFEAVLTGTTSLVLDEMANRGLSYAEALAVAQERGIAEPDPSFDVEGWDTAAKLVIIANAVLDAGLRLDSLPREGISCVSREDVASWQVEGLTPRLVGFLERRDKLYRAGVELRLYPQDHPFALLRGSMKAIRVLSEEMGVLTVMGGASDPRATAAAALKDFEHALMGS